MTVSTTLIVQLRERLAPLFANPAIELVILFGSMASGTGHTESDLDLAVRGSGVLDLVALTNDVTRLLHMDDVDLVDLRRASPLLTMEVARKGRLLYEKTPGSYPAFCSLAHRRYIDTSKLRIAQRETIRQFLRDRGAA